MKGFWVLPHQRKINLTTKYFLATEHEKDSFISVEFAEMFVAGMEIAMMT